MRWLAVWCGLSFYFVGLYVLAALRQRRRRKNDEATSPLLPGESGVAASDH